MALGIGLISLSLFLVGQGGSEVPVDGLRLGAFGLLALQMGLAGLGMGLAAPAANNAVLDLMPERAGAITGLRRMFRSTGGILGTAVVVLIMELVPDRAAGLRAIFAGAAALLVGLVLPLVFLIPDSARERRRAGRARPVPTPASHDD
jgi:MFS family permease